MKDTPQQRVLEIGEEQAVYEHEEQLEYIIDKIGEPWRKSILAVFKLGYAVGRAHMARAIVDDMGLDR